MDPRAEEVLRYLGVREPPESLRREAEETLEELRQTITPRYVYKIFPLEREGKELLLPGAGLRLSGATARTMLGDCDGAAILACTLGAEFDRLLRREQIRDMARAVITDACGSVLVENGCDKVEEALRKRLPEVYWTDRFSPGYGDLPLTLQRPIAAALDLERSLGVYVKESMMMDPSKSVTAFVGISRRPQAARVRGCDHCGMRGTCALAKGGERCGI